MLIITIIIIIITIIIAIVTIIIIIITIIIIIIIIINKVPAKNNSPGGFPLKKTKG